MNYLQRHRKQCGLFLIVLGLGILGATFAKADGIGRDFMDPEVISPAPCTIWFGLPCHERSGVVVNNEDGPQSPVAPSNPIRDFVDAAQDALDRLERIETEPEVEVVVECPAN